MTSAPPLPPPTRSGLLSSARHVVLPDGIVSTGFPSVKATCAEIGIGFDPWQEELNRCLLAKDAGGLYAADTAVISICRQAGKTFDIGAIVFALCIKHPGLTVIWTAHRFKVSRETFNALRVLAKSPQLAPHIDYDDITTGTGNECIPFRNGSRIMFAARERGAIRGFTKVGILILDEAQILTEAAMSDLVPTTNQADNPLIILMGTPPKPNDPGEVFTTLRAEALAGESEGVLYVEFSADPDCDSDDWDAVAQANPSFPKRTGKRAVLRMRKLLTNDDDYRREGLGIWPEDDEGDAVIDSKKWAALADMDSRRERDVAVGVDVAQDGSYAAISIYGLRSDELGHGQLVDYRDGVAWVVPRLLEMRDQFDPVVFAMGRGTAKRLETDLQLAGISPSEDPERPKRGELAMMAAADMGAATGQMRDAVREGSFRYVPSAQLDGAVAGAKVRQSGDALVWVRTEGGSEIGALVSLSAARWGYVSRAPIVRRKYDLSKSVW